MVKPKYPVSQKDLALLQTAYKKTIGQTEKKGLRRSENERVLDTNATFGTTYQAKLP